MNAKTRFGGRDEPGQAASVWTVHTRRAGLAWHNTLSKNNQNRGVPWHALTRIFCKNTWQKQPRFAVAAGIKAEQIGSTLGTPRDQCPSPKEPWSGGHLHVFVQVMPRAIKIHLSERGASFSHSLWHAKKFHLLHICKNYISIPKNIIHP